MASEKVLQQKQAYVADLTAKINGAVAGVIVDYSGITVADDTALRRQLREAGVEYAVVKNTLLKRAVDAANMSGLDDVMSGTTALALSNDYVAAAKILCKYAESNEHFNVKAGFMDGEAIGADKVTELSKLPSKEGLLSMLLSVLNGPIRGLAVALNAIAEKEPAAEEAAPTEEAAPVEAAPAAEAAPADAPAAE